MRRVPIPHLTSLPRGKEVIKLLNRLHVIHSRVHLFVLDIDIKIPQFLGNSYSSLEYNRIMPSNKDIQNIHIQYIYRIKIYKRYTYREHYCVSSGMLLPIQQPNPTGSISTASMIEFAFPKHQNKIHTSCMNITTCIYTRLFMIFLLCLVKRNILLKL